MNSSSEPPSSWRILLPVGVGTALSLAGDSAMYTVLPTHTAAAGVALASVGILLAANRLIRLLANGAAGWTSDKLSKRVVFIFSLFLGAFSTALYGLTTGFAWLLLGRLLWGVAWAGIWVAGNGLILQTAPVPQRGRWVGRYHFFFFFGAALGAVLGGFLTDRIGYHEAMLVAAVLGLAGAVLALFFLRGEGRVARGEEEGREENKQQSTENSEQCRRATATRTTEEGEEREQNSEGTRWGELLSATAVLGVNRLIIAGILASTFALYLLDMLGETVAIGGMVVGVATVTGVLLGARIVLGMLLTPAIGSLSDRARNRWRVVAGGLLPGIAGFLLLAVNLPLAMFVGLPLTSITGSSNQSMSTALIGDLGQRRKHGRYLGLLYTVGDLGSAIGPLLAFALLPLWGISGLYWLCAALLGLLLLMSLFWTGRKRKPVNNSAVQQFDN